MSCCVVFIYNYVVIYIVSSRLFVGVQTGADEVGDDLAGGWREQVEELEWKIEGVKMVVKCSRKGNKRI